MFAVYGGGTEKGVCVVMNTQDQPSIEGFESPERGREGEGRIKPKGTVSSFAVPWETVGRRKMSCPRTWAHG